MKKRITAFILAVLMCLSTIGIFASTAAPIYSNNRTKAEIAKIQTMELKLDNGKYRLYIDEATAEVAIENVKTGEIMLTNPYNASDRTLSQLILYYKAVNASASAPYYSFNNCINYKNNQVKYEYTADSVIVTYDFGQKVKTFVIPQLITKTDMDELLNEMRAAGVSESTIANDVLYNYDYCSVTIDQNGNDISATVPTNKRENLIKDYGQYGIETEPLYALKARLNDNRKTNTENVFKKIEYTKERMEEHHAKIHFVPEDVASTHPGFIIPLEYKLTENGFTAEVDAAKISYDRTAVTLETISVLPYLNAAEYREEGYTFIPDGSGALVRFEDVASQNAANNITFNLYGNDNAFYSLDATILEQSIMPVFGMKIKEAPYDSGFFAVIENADAIASITSAHSQLYHSIYPTFKMSAADSLTMSSSSTGVEGKLNILAGATFTEKCTVRYFMLTPENLANEKGLAKHYDTTYVDMAKCYREYLTDKGELNKFKPNQVSKDTKLFLEVFGSIKVEKKIATFPVTVNEALTTFEDIKTIHKELTDLGVGPMNFILTGFANGGLSAKYPTKVKWMNSVGGKKGFEDLLVHAQENGYEVSPNFDFAYSSYIGGRDNINYRDHGGKSLDKRFSIKLTYDPAWQMLAYIGGIVISPNSYDYAYSKFAKSVERYNIQNVSVATLGSDLNSDFNEDCFTYRTASQRMTVAMLSKLSGKADGTTTSYKLLVEKGNAYSIGYASYITKAPLDSSRVANESEAVPFTGMVLHGSIVFTGEALNMEGDDDYALLKALENGANLYFTIAYDNVEYLKTIWDYSKFYSIRYDLWKDFIVEKYSEYNELMKSKQSSFITEHEILNTTYGERDGYELYRLENGNKKALENSRVVRVEYENGEGYFLNYNADYDVTVVYNGKTFVIPALGYAAYDNL